MARNAELEGGSVIRFIIKTQRVCRISGMDYSGLSTFDAECPELEDLLSRGGSGESGCEIHQVVDAEITEQPNEKVE